MGVVPVSGKTLASLTTVRTGGAAEFFATADSVDELDELRRWATERNLTISVIGRGSNLLIPDGGVSGLVVQLGREFAQIEFDGQRVRCGGASRFPRAASQATRQGLSGIEFGEAIPGTIGGAVRMNANAYDGELRSVLEWVEVHGRDGLTRRRPDDLGFTYRGSNLRSDEIVTAVQFLLKRAPRAEIEERVARMRAERKRSQPSAGRRNFGSVFKNPTLELKAWKLLTDAGAGELQFGGARFSDKHINFIDVVGDAATADVVALIAAARDLVWKQFGVLLECEVVTLGAHGL